MPTRLPAQATPASLMRRIVLAVVAANLWFAAPVPTEASPFDYFLGQWLCTTGMHSAVHKTYQMTLRGQWLRLDNTYLNGPVVGEFVEYYSFEPGFAQWTVVSLGSNGTLFVGTSADWKNGRLDFEGAESTPIGPARQREIYTRTNDESFGREFDINIGSGWQLGSNEECRKLPQR